MRVAGRLRAVHESSDRHARRAAVAALVDAVREDGVDDPLLAGAVALEVADPALRAELEAVAARAEPLRASVHALVVDPQGRGHVVEVVVALVPGSTGVWTPLAVRRDADLAAQVAASVALGPELARWSVRWQLAGVVAELEGASLGLPLAVAIHAARRGLVVPTDVALTGALDVHGRVSAVSGMAPKLAAARDAGLSRVITPPGGADDLRAPVEDLSAATALLWPDGPARTGRRAPRWLALLAVPALAWTQAGDVVDAAVFHPLIDTLRAPLTSDDTAVLVLPVVPDLRLLRARYAGLVDGLVEAGATVIAFDLVFGASDPADVAFGEAIARAQARGVTVVAGARLVDGVRSTASEALGGLAPGLVEVELDAVAGRVRRVPVERASTAGPVWALGVEVLRGHLHAAAPSLEDGVLSVGITRNPAGEGRAWLAPVTPPPVLRLDEPAGWSAARGRAVIVGVGDAARDWLRTPSGDQHGAEVHAALVETLARQAALRATSAGAEAALATALALATAWTRRRLPERVAVWAALPGLVALVGVAGWVALGGVTAVAGLVVAWMLGWWAGRR